MARTIDREGVQDRNGDAVGAAPPTVPVTVKAILLTWLVTAAWDFACASMLGVFAYGSTLIRFWQGVASVPLGARAFQMGWRGFVAGLLLHAFVAFMWSAAFVVLVSWWSGLRRLVAGLGGAIAVAVVYGPLIWLVMSLLVIPSATGRPPAFGFRWWVQIFVHVPFVTLPLVLTARRALRLADADAMRR